MNISLYQDKDSWIHRLDPRTKMIGVAIIFAICLCFNHPLYMAVLGVGILMTIFSSHSQGALRAVRYLMLLLFFFSLLLWPFFIKGPTILYQWKFLELSRESILYSMAMGLRLVMFVMGGLLLLATTRNEEISSGLIKIKIPYPVAFALATALRLVPTFVGAGVTIIQAQVSRGLDLESRNILSRFGKFLPLAIPMFISAIRYTNLLSMALESRGFSPAAPRTLYFDPQMTKRDWVVLACLSLILAVFLYLRLGMGLGAVIPERL